MKFIGIDNYTRLFQDTYFCSRCGISVCMFLMYVPSVVILSFLLAVLLNQKVRGIRAFRVLFYLPCLTSTVASSMVWKWLMNPQGGLLNMLLSAVGLPTSAWLNESKTAMVSIVIICVWSTLASNIMIYLAALRIFPDLCMNPQALTASAVGAGFGKLHCRWWHQPHSLCSRWR